MTTFVLKLFFTGLIAFVPNQDGTELTVLLLNVHNDYQTSDGSSLAHHTPLLLARAGSCSGQCPTRDADIAQFIFEDQSEAAALDSAAIVDRGVRGDERRRIDAESPRDLGGVRADAGAVADQGTAIDDDVHRTKCTWRQC